MRRKKPEAAESTIHVYHYYPAGNNPTDLAPVLCPGDSVTVDYAAKGWAQGVLVVALYDEHVGLPGPPPPGSDIHVEKRTFICFGRLLWTAEKQWVYVGDDARGVPIYKHPACFGRIVAVLDAAGREASPQVFKGWSVAEERERFFAARQLAANTLQSMRAEVRRIAAQAGRRYLATRRWTKRHHHLLHPSRAHDWSVPKPGRTIRARVA